MTGRQSEGSSDCQVAHEIHRLAHPATIISVCVRLLVGRQDFVSIEFPCLKLTIRNPDPTYPSALTSMSHTTPNNSPLHKRFLQATKYWISPGYHPDVKDFSALWFGSNCALLNYTAETAGEFDDETQRCLSNLLALKPHQHTDAAKKWLRRANGKDPEFPNAEVDALAPTLANSVMAIAHGIAAVYRWRESHWGNDPVALESAREHVKTCWRSYAAALPVDGPLELHKCNLYLNPTKLAGLMVLLNEPTTATHWLMLQRLFAFLLQNAPDGEPTRTRSASEATETISTEKASLARRVSIPTTVEHEVVTHLVGVNVRGETRQLTVSRVAEGPPGWYLDPTELGATCVAPEILEQLALASRVATNERRIENEKQLKPDDPIPPLRVAIHSNLLASLTGRSAGLSLLMSMHAAANDGFLREDTLASSDIRVRPDFDQSQPLRLSDIETIPVEPKTVRLKAETIREVPHLKRFVLSHAQTALDAAGQKLAWDTWTTDKVQESFRVEYVPIENGQAAWQQMSGGPQIAAVEKYLADIIHYADTVPPYFPPGTELPNVRVQVRVRTELFRPDDFLARQDEHHRLNGVDPRRIYSHRLHDDEEQRGQQTPSEEIVLDWDSQIRPKLRRGMLLGDPGLGKSWLQKHEALALAESAKTDLRKNGMLHSLTWPILLPLSDLANALAERKQNQPRDLLSVLMNVLHAREADPVVLEQITAAWGGDRCILLLDAWDEVDLDQQPALRRCLEEWARSHPQGRVLITSRIVGRPEPFWPTAKGSEADREMELQPFGDQQTREFIERFFRSSPQIAAALIAALPQAPQLRGLSQIPLLLSFLCRYAYDQIQKNKSSASDTPTLDLRAIHRNELYESIVTAFLKGVWHPDHTTVDDTSVTRLFKVVSYVSYHLLKESYQKFPLTLFEDKLADALRHSARGFTVTNSEFDYLRNTLIGENGLVIPASVGTNPSYLFLHLTFQEFFAAHYVISLPWAELEPVLAEYWDHPDWHEVWDLVVLANAGNPAHIENMVTTISKNGHPLDEHLCRYRFLSLHWLIISGQEPSELTPNLGASLQWLITVSTQRRFNYWSDALFRTIADTYGRLPRVFELHLFERLSYDFASSYGITAEDIHIRDVIVEALAMHAGTQSVQTEFLRRLDRVSMNHRKLIEVVTPYLGTTNPYQAAVVGLLDKQEYFARDAAAKALAPHAGNNPLQATLLRRLDDQDPEVRNAVAKALAPHAGIEAVQTALLRRLDDHDKNVRWNVATALAPHAGIEFVQAAFLRRLDDQDYSVFSEAVRALGPYADNETVRAAILRQLYNQDSLFSECVAHELAPYVDFELVRTRLLPTLLRSEEADAVKTVAYALTRFAGTDTDLVQTALLYRLDDHNQEICFAVATVLAPHAGIEIVQAALLRRLENQDLQVCNAVVMALAPYAGIETVRAALLRRLDDQDFWVRKTVAEALAPYAGFEPVQAALLRHLDDEDPSVRKAVVVALAPFAGTDSLSNKQLLDLRFRHGRRLYNFGRLVSSVFTWMQYEPIQVTLLRRLEDQESEVRKTVAQALAPYAGIEPVQAALTRQLDDPDSTVLAAVAQALAPYADRKPIQVALLRRLNDELSDVRQIVGRILQGLASDERRNARPRWRFGFVWMWLRRTKVW